jgi:hypothetical protein
VQLLHDLPQPGDAARLRLDELELVAVVHTDVGVLPAPEIAISVC